MLDYSTMAGSGHSITDPAREGERKGEEREGGERGGEREEREGEREEREREERERERRGSIHKSVNHVMTMC